MAQTNLMRADEIAHGFNSVNERLYWKATLAGTRTNPEVHFNSRSSMVQVAYVMQHDHFTVTFNKTTSTFGDFLASAYRSLEQVLAGLTAAGLPFLSPEETPVLRLEYGPHYKVAVVHMAAFGDDWREIEPKPFKVPQRNTEESTISPIDL